MRAARLPTAQKRFPRGVRSHRIDVAIMGFGPGSGQPRNHHRSPRQAGGAALQAPPVARSWLASVYDSDEFAFLVFEGGRQVDGHATQDDLLPFPFETWSAKKRAREWSRLFGRSLDLSDVRAADPIARPVCRRSPRGAVPPRGDPRRTRHPQSERLRSAGGADPALLPSSRRRRSGGGDATVAQLIPPSMEAKYRSGEASKPLPLMPGEETGYYVVLTGPAGAFSDPVLELFGPAIERRLVEVFYCPRRMALWRGERNWPAAHRGWRPALRSRIPTRASVSSAHPCPVCRPSSSSFHPDRKPS